MPCSQFAAQLKSQVSPTFKQAALEPHLLSGLNFCPTNCHVNLMEVYNPKRTPSVGQSFSIRFGCKPFLIGLDPKQGTCLCLLEMVIPPTLQYPPRTVSEGQQSRDIMCLHRCQGPGPTLLLDPISRWGL